MRAEEAGDRPFLRLLYGAGRAAELAPVPWPAAAKQAFLDDQFRLQTRHYDALADAERWIVERDGEPVGRLYLARGERVWRVLEIGLVPPVQGQGIGTALLRRVQEQAVAAGAQAVELRVVPDNVGAIALYRRLGFAPAGASGDGTRQILTWAA